MTIVEFRFYAELNHFLAPSLRNRSFRRACPRDATIKHMIEALGVPHTEVALILVNGAAADFAYQLGDGQYVSVYPYFSTLDIRPLYRLRPSLAEEVRFIADAHLGLLAKNLRMLGFDVLYRNDFSDAEIARTAVEENRIVLSRDRDLLIRKEIVHGCYLYAKRSDEQLAEVLNRFNLTSRIRAFSRCLNCNGSLREVKKSEVADRVPPHSHQVYERFFECEGCTQIYWEGSHVSRMRRRLAQLLGMSALMDTV